MIDTKTLRWARKRRGLSQGQVALKIGLALHTVSKYERGVILPSVPALCRLSELYDVDIDTLIDWDRV